MSDLLRTAVGAALIALSVYELVVTAISVSGVQGPLTGRLVHGTWHLLRRASAGPRMRWVLHTSGPLVILLAFSLWVLLAVAGWGLVFSSEGAVQARGDRSLTPFDPFFYAGGQILGQGAPDVTTAQVGWKLLEQVLALHGVALLSLALAWVIPVVGGVVAQRQLATRMYLLGDTPADVVRRVREGRGPGDLHLYLNTIGAGLTDLSHRQFAFPVVQHFFTPDIRAAIQPRLAILTEATFLLAAAPEDQRVIHPGVLHHYWRAVEDYLERLTTRFAHTAEEPPASGARAFADAGVVGKTGALDDVYDQHERLRRMLSGAMGFAGWRWEETVLQQVEDDADGVDHDAREAGGDG